MKVMKMKKIILTDDDEEFKESECKCAMCNCMNTIYTRWEGFTPQTRVLKRLCLIIFVINSTKLNLFYYNCLDPYFVTSIISVLSPNIQNLEMNFYYNCLVPFTFIPYLLVFYYKIYFTTICSQVYN